MRSLQPSSRSWLSCPVRLLASRSVASVMFCATPSSLFQGAGARFIADLVYGLVMAGALCEIEAGMHRQGLAPTVALGGILPDHVPRDVQCAPSIAWHDDAAFVFTSCTAEALRAAAANTAGLVSGAFNSRGLTLSFAMDKSEMLLSPQCRGSEPVRKALFGSSQPYIYFLPESH